MKRIMFIFLVLSFVSVGCATNKKVDGQKDFLMNEIAKAKKEAVIETTEALKELVKVQIVSEGKDELINQMTQGVYVNAKKDIDVYNEILTQATVKKIDEINEQNLKKLEEILITGDFIKTLEEKIRKGFELDNKKIFDEKKKDFIRQCVQESIDEIVTKEVGIKKEYLSQ